MEVKCPVVTRKIKIQVYSVKVYSGLNLESTTICSILKQGKEITLFLNTLVF